MLNYLKNSSFYINYGRMYPYVKPYWFRALLAMCLCIPIGSMDAVIAMSLKPYMDMVLIEQTVGTSAWYAPLFIIGFTLVQGSLMYLAAYLNAWVGSHITNDLKLTMYNKLLTFESAYFDRRNSGDIVFRFNNDVDLACSGLLLNLRNFLSRAVSSVSLIGVLFYNSWQLSLIAIGVLGCSFYPVTRVRTAVKALMKQTVAVGSATITAYNETFAGNRTITAYNYQPHQSQKFRKILAGVFRIHIKMAQKTSWLTPALHITASFGIAATIGYGSHLILTNQLTTGGFVSFISALLMLYNPIKRIGAIYNSVQYSFLAMERVFQILDSKSLICDKEGSVELKQIEREISFQNVGFEYQKGQPILKNINLTVGVGQSVAFVGNSGGGKSTLVSLLPRFYDVVSGSIRIDGVDIRDMSLKSLREKMAIVFQDNFLFSGSIRDNLCVGSPEADDKALWQALELAYLKEFVTSLKEGLDANIGERGIMLSGGQKQRLAIARAFLRNAPIIILDEATSALDNRSEAVVQKAIENLMKDRTVFVIAHRLSTVRGADCIVVIQEGQIAEMGAHEELMAVENGVYRALYETQFKKKGEKQQLLLS